MADIDPTTQDKRVQQARDKALKQLRDAAGAWEALVATPQGKQIMTDLEQRFYDAPIGGPRMAEQVGSREVVRYIKALIRGAKDPDGLRVEVIR
jgi:hypothetical protein